MVFSRIKNKNLRGFVIFDRLTFTYTKPRKKLANPFIITVRLRDVDFYDREKSKFVKVPNIKSWSFGAYSKWGIAPC